MPTADQWEKIAEQVCRSLGGRHVAARVVCPVGVRLLREVVASRLEGRPGSPARVLDSARATVRSLARLPLPTADPEPDAPDDEVQAERDPLGPKIPSIPIIPHRALIRGAKGATVGAGGRTVADIVTRLTRAGINVPKLRKLKGFAQHAVEGGFIPGESGF